MRGGGVLGMLQEEASTKAESVPKKTEMAQSVGTQTSTCQKSQRREILANPVKSPSNPPLNV